MQSLVSAVLWPPCAVGLVISLFIGAKKLIFDADIGNGRCCRWPFRHSWPAFQLFLLSPAGENCSCAPITESQARPIYRVRDTLRGPSPVGARQRLEGPRPACHGISDQPRRPGPPTRLEFGIKTAPPQKGSTERSPDRRARWDAASDRRLCREKATSECSAGRSRLLSAAAPALNDQTPKSTVTAATQWPCPGSLGLGLGSGLCDQTGRRAKPPCGWSLPGRARWPRPDDEQPGDKKKCRVDQDATAETPSA